MFTFIIQLWQDHIGGTRDKVLFITADSFQEAKEQFAGVFNQVGTIRND